MSDYFLGTQKAPILWNDPHAFSRLFPVVGVNKWEEKLCVLSYSGSLGEMTCFSKTDTPNLLNLLYLW